MENRYENGICQKLSLTLGGVSQFVSIRGENLGNPVLLVLHGGPGSPLTGMSHVYQRPWEKHYTVVNWDQRCCGATASLSGTDSPVKLTMRLILNDALELTDWLLERFGKKKIVLLGHSWGTTLGSVLAQEHPEKYLCYISTGTATNMRREAKVVYDHLHEKYEAAGSRRKLRKLEAIGPYWESETGDWDKMLALNALIIQEGYSSARITGLGSALKREIIPMLTCPEYSLRDRLRIFGYKPYIRMNVEELYHYAPEEQGFRYDIPVYYINGDTDWQTPYVLAKERYEQTEAPDKAFYTLHRCAHCWDIDAPEEMTELLCGEILEKVKNIMNKENENGSEQ